MHDVYTPLLTERDARNIRDGLGYTDEEIHTLDFRSVPSQSLKALIAFDYSKRFDLYRVPGFFFWENRWCLLIPIERGFMRPYYNGTPFIQGFLIYEHAKAKPFLLNSTGKPYGARAVPFLPEMEMVA